MKNKTMRRPFCVYLWTYAVLPALFIALVGLSRAQAAEPQAVNLYTYHTHQPFITGNGEGMTYDLAAFLSQRSNGAYNFKVVPSSRPRINRLIESDRWGVIPWVNPKWFKDPKMTIYLWSERKLIQDANAIISHKRKPVDYRRPDVLQGMTFGGIKGHRYAGIDDFIAKGGNLRRLDADNHADNLRKLLRGDIDVMLMPQSAAFFAVAKQNLGQKVFFSPTPHSRYERGILIINHRRKLQRYIDSVLEKFDDKWSIIITRYK